MDQAARGCRARRLPCRTFTRAFSLAELMIALVILGLGLLFIAAALPVGLEYTRQTVDLATSDAAGDYAVQQLDINLRTSLNLSDATIGAGTSGNFRLRLDTIERPRDYDTVNFAWPPTAAVTSLPMRLLPSYEPVFKVRPFSMGNISMSTITGNPHNKGVPITDDPESLINRYLIWGFTTFRPGVTLNFNSQDWWLEAGIPFRISSALQTYSLVNHPVLSGLARVYPPIEPLAPNAETGAGFSVTDFYKISPGTGVAYHPYKSRKANWSDLEPLYQEHIKAIDQRIVWTAFYRRIDYRSKPGADNTYYNPNLVYGNRSTDDVADAPLQYEIIYVIAERPTVNHRFPMQNDLAGSGINPFQQPQALVPPTSGVNNAPVGADRLAPTPWLVTFTQIPLPNASDYTYIPARPRQSTLQYCERIFKNTYNPPSTLTFKCNRKVGALLPPGSIFIPALNDQCYPMTAIESGMPPAPWMPYQQVGFVPSAPNTIPIYEVLERIEEPRTPNETTLIVKNPGYVPWLNSGLNPNNWPVWVIPPAFSQRDRNDQPIFEPKSPILKIVRRTVTLPEISR